MDMQMWIDGGVCALLSSTYQCTLLLDFASTKPMYWAHDLFYMLGSDFTILAQPGIHRVYTNGCRVWHERLVTHLARLHIIVAARGKGHHHFVFQAFVLLFTEVGYFIKHVIKKRRSEKHVVMTRQECMTLYNHLIWPSDHVNRQKHLLIHC